MMITPEQRDFILDEIGEVIENCTISTDIMGEIGKILTPHTEPEPVCDHVWYGRPSIGDTVCGKCGMVAKDTAQEGEKWDAEISGVVEGFADCPAQDEEVEMQECEECGSIWINEKMLEGNPLIEEREVGGRKIEIRWMPSKLESITIICNDCNIKDGEQ